LYGAIHFRFKAVGNNFFFLKPRSKWASCRKLLDYFINLQFQIGRYSLGIFYFQGNFFNNYFL